MAFSLGPVADDGLYDIQVIRSAAFDVTFTSFMVGDTPAYGYQAISGGAS